MPHLHHPADALHAGDVCAILPGGLLVQGGCQRLDEALKVWIQQLAHLLVLGELRRPKQIKASLSFPSCDDPKH